MKKMMLWGVGALATWASAIAIGVFVVSNHVPVSLPMRSVITTPYIASAKGVWQNHFALTLGNWANSTEIKCWKPAKSCSVITAFVSQGGLLGQMGDTAEVKSWDGNFIVSESVSECYAIRYTIDAALKVAYALRQPRNPLPAGCDNFANTEKTMLLDGIAITHEKQEEVKPWFFRLAVMPFELFL